MLEWNMADTPLQTVPGWSENQVAELKNAWITTAEQVVALSATEGGMRSLAEQLNTSEEEVSSLVDSARAALPPSVRSELERAADTSDYGLGALRPKNQKP
jgi:hypothetical protein